MIICGCDEAGRGPVIGPMVLAGVAISKKKLPKLKKLGVKDSKLLTPKRREELYKEIIKLVDGYSIVEVSPQEIDQRNAVGTNLNKLEAIKIAQILTELKPDQVIVDSPEPTKSQKFAHMILEYMEEEPKITAEHKADLNYPVCAAASILAKVTRDNAVRAIEKEIGHSIGSGYQSDPKCQEFLKNHFNDDHLHHIRKCWVTYKMLKNKKSQTNLADW